LRPSHPPRTVGLEGHARGTRVGGTARRERIPDIEIIAHRGYSARAPENTLAAIQAALDAGADSVEFDLHVAADGTPVLIHDANLGRTTNGVGPVRRRTVGQLRGLDAGAWFSPAFEGERIPTLAEALEMVRGRVNRAYPDVKGYRELEDLDRMVKITRDLGMLEQTTFLSLDWRIVERIHGRDEAVTVGYVVDAIERYPEALDRAIVRGRAILDLDVEIVLAAPHLVAECHREGIPTAVWTVNDEVSAERMRRAGVRRLTTDEVEKIRDWRSRVEPLDQSPGISAPSSPSGSGEAGIST
jgi:glycerophosphoryl diester phosphodiesterase